MFRTLIASVVLFFTLGQNAPLLCSLVCHGHDVSAACAHESEPDLQWASGGDCDESAVAAVLFLPEEPRAAAERGGAPALTELAAALRVLTESQAPPGVERPGAGASDVGSFRAALRI